MFVAQKLGRFAYKHAKIYCMTDPKNTKGTDEDLLKDDLDEQMDEEGFDEEELADDADEDEDFDETTVEEEEPEIGDITEDDFDETDEAGDDEDDYL
jgi:hypothetical protein